MLGFAIFSGAVAIMALLAVALTITLNMGVSPLLLDAQQKVTRALPASTTAVTSLTALDTEQSSKLASDVARYELEIVAPAVSTAQLPDTKTFTYKIIHSDNSDLSSPSDLALSLIVQTGAGGAGAAAASTRYRPPMDHKRYIGLVITPSASGTGDASGATATLQARF